MHGYPRPLLRRARSFNLNGPWEFAIDPDGAWSHERHVIWDQRPIQVPFSPETPASGIADQGMYRAVWYRRTVDAARPADASRERVLLHFGAVDHAATVWVNGHLVATHEGGYTPFTADITDVMEERRQRIVVRAVDDPLDMSKPRGKQDWLPQPHSIWYPRTTGIWQSVWLERVPATRIGSLRWSCDVDAFSISLEACIDGVLRDGLRLQLQLSRRGEAIADDVWSVSGSTVRRTIHLPDPGIDAARADWLWRPANPVLFDVKMDLIDQSDASVDSVASYTALRSVAADGDRFTLNGLPIRLRMALDQGYWPESGLTPPSDAALRRDVELAKAMGFNAVRKHQKIEDPRYLYWADRLGLMVWGEMPSAYAFDTTAVRRLSAEWAAAIERDRSHPCIVAWVPFNESWGLPAIARSQQQRDYAEAMRSLARALDPSRPVITNDGWEAVRTDMLGIHDYDQNAASLSARWQDPLIFSAMVEGGRAGGRHISLDGQAPGTLPVLLTEFGGIAFAPDNPEGAWGYSRVRTSEALAERYTSLVSAVRDVGAFSGFCYTQFADTYQETNGLLYEDRTPKIPIEQIARATRGR